MMYPALEPSLYSKLSTLWGQPTSAYCLDLKNIPLQTLEENRARLARNLPDLWYSVNPGTEDLYKKVKAQWPHK